MPKELAADSEQKKCEKDWNFTFYWFPSTRPNDFWQCLHSGGQYLPLRRWSPGNPDGKQRDHKTGEIR